MTYTKPEVAVLGNADRVIASQVQPKPGASFDGVGRPLITPAYDLDE
jgi:hypothetical protein